MARFIESEHPREEDGKFAPKGEYRQNASYSEIESEPVENEVIETEHYKPKAYTEKAKQLLQEVNNPDLRERITEYIGDVASEPPITSDLRQVVKAIGTTLIGEDFRLKNSGSSRFMEKLEEEPTKRNKDNVRYTVALDDGVNNYHKAVEELTKRGYKQVKVKNYWLHEGNYKGINTNWQAPDGTIFEIQYHSPENADVKEKQHAQYEVIRSKTASNRAKAIATAKQQKISKLFKMPNGIESVKEI